MKVTTIRGIIKMSASFANINMMMCYMAMCCCGMGGPPM